MVAGHKHQRLTFSRKPLILKPGLRGGQPDPEALAYQVVSCGPRIAINDWLLFDGGQFVGQGARSRGSPDRAMPRTRAGRPVRRGTSASRRPPGTGPARHPPRCQGTACQVTAPRPAPSWRRQRQAHSSARSRARPGSPRTPPGFVSGAPCTLVNSGANPRRSTMSESSSMGVPEMTCRPVLPCARRRKSSAPSTNGHASTGVVNEPRVFARQLLDALGIRVAPEDVPLEMARLEPAGDTAVGTLILRSPRRACPGSRRRRCRDTHRS